MQHGKTAWQSMVLVAACTLLNTLGQSSWKLGMSDLKLDIIALITNFYLIGGFVAYGINFFLLGFALRNGELSILYPIFSLGYVWVALVSVLKFHEPFTLVNWLGLACIIVGIITVTRSAKRDAANE